MDIACAAFSGVAANDVVELAVYITQDGYGILTKYPESRIATDGPIKTFSLNVWLIS